MNKNAIVLIGDIVASRRIKDRAAIQKKIAATFQRLSARNEGFLSPLTITLGDEFQAVYGRADFLFYHIWRIMFTLYPEQARFSIGTGEITTRINRKQAIGMDGPAFHSARSGLETLKNSSFSFLIDGGRKPEFQLANNGLFLLSRFSEGWKDSRLQILWMLFEGMSPKEIALKLHITDKAVYKNMNAGALPVVVDLSHEIASQLNATVWKS